MKKFKNTPTKKINKTREAKPIKVKKGIVIGFLSALIVIAVFGLLALINSFFNKHYFTFQTPIIIQSPILLHQRETEVASEIVEIAKAIEPTPTPDPWYYLPTDRTITNREIAQADNKYILWSVYRLESSRGKNDGCKNSGKFNGYGYGQSTFSWNCFDTFEEVTRLVDKWFNTRKAEGYTLSEAVCYYNTGIKQQSDCDYLTKFNSL